MDNFSIFIEKMFGIADHTIIKTSTHSHQNITILHGHIGFVSTMHT